MNDFYHPEQLRINTPEAKYIVELADGVTVLCEAHMNAVRLACEAAGAAVNIYEIPDEDEPIACQACHLAEVRRPQIILPH